MNDSVKIFIVNLKHKTDLRCEMIQKLSNVSIPYEFFDAVYGRDLNDEFYEKHNIVIDPLFRNSWTSSSITTGEIGCSLSHYFIWKKALEQGIKYPIILEDDAILEPTFEKTCLEMIDKNPEFDMIYLGRKTFIDDPSVFKKINDQYNLMNPAFSYWTVGYMLSMEGTKKLVNSGFLQNLITVDEFLPMLYLNLQNLYCNKSRYSIDQFHTYGVEPKIVKPKPNTFIASETEAQPFYRLKYENNFYNNEFQAVTVGTDPVDGYKRFVDSTITYGFPYVCLGFGQPWCGNDMAKGAGGGHKVVLLKQYLDKFDDNDKRFIIFSDCYDAVLSRSPDVILSKFRELQQKLNADIIFSSEALIWPDSSLEPQFPDVGTPYKFLNSGGFMGTIENIKKMIQTPIESHHDDQLYYQKEYLKSVKGETELKIKLDARAEIFQTLSTHFDYITINDSQSKVHNKLTNTTPMVIHGNGGPNSKSFIDKLCNYINLRFREIYGYKDNHSDMKKLDKLAINEYPTIKVLIRLENEDSLHYILNLQDQDYPEAKLTYQVLNLTSKDLSGILKRLRDTLSVNIESDRIENNSEVLRTYYTKFFENNDSDYVFLANTTHVIEEKQWLKKAICSNLDVVAPMLTGKDNVYYANFWGKVGNDGFYERSHDYLKLVNREYKGYWNVPYVSGSMLIHKNKYAPIVKAISKERIREREPNNFDMFFCRCLQLRGIFMYVNNFSRYGYLYNE